MWTNIFTAYVTDREFGSRHAQYDGGPSFAPKQNRNFDFKRATGLVDKALNLPAVG